MASGRPVLTQLLVLKTTCENDTNLRR